MRFEHTEEQRDFARSIDQLLASADTVAAARACLHDSPNDTRAVHA